MIRRTGLLAKKALPKRAVVNRPADALRGPFKNDFIGNVDNPVSELCKGC